MVCILFCVMDLKSGYTFSLKTHGIIAAKETFKPIARVEDPRKSHKIVYLSTRFDKHFLNATIKVLHVAQQT